MRIAGIIWLEEIEEKLYSKHNVAPSEVMEALENHPQFRFVEKGHRIGENVYFALARSDAGRHLIIFFVYQFDRRAMILSARDMTRTERRQYGQKNRSSISQAESYRAIGEFWDAHDVTDYWDATEPVDFEVDIQSETRYYALDKELAGQVHRIAGRRGISAETLLNLWVQEKVTHELVGSTTK